MKYWMTRAQEGMTVKEYFKSFYLGRGKIEQIRAQKRYKINQKTPKWEEAILHEGDLLELDIEEEVDFTPVEKNLTILYEDDYLLAVSKTPDCVIYPEGKEGNDTLVNFIAGYYQRKGISHTIRYIYRLDKETSGVFLVAKDWLTEAYLCHEMEEGNIKKYYIALVEGKLKDKKGEIRKAVAKDRHANNRFRVDEKGKMAVTRYQVLKERENTSLVQCELVTGRTHQIRVHFSSLGHPLVGDVLYGSKRKAKRTMLHASRIVFYHPFLERELEIQAPLLEEMKRKK